jgi:hypothetical protein
MGNTNRIVRMRGVTDRVAVTGSVDKISEKKTEMRCECGAKLRVATGYAVGGSLGIQGNKAYKCTKPDGPQCGRVYYD